MKSCRVVRIALALIEFASHELDPNIYITTATQFRTKTPCPADKVGRQGGWQKAPSAGVCPEAKECSLRIEKVPPCTRRLWSLLGKLTKEGTSPSPPSLHTSPCAGGSLLRKVTKREHRRPLHPCTHRRVQGGRSWKKNDRKGMPSPPSLRTSPCAGWS